MLVASDTLDGLLGGALFRRSAPIIQVGVDGSLGNRQSRRPGWSVERRCKGAICGANEIGRLPRW
jgi:hypothetical protein